MTIKESGIFPEKGSVENAEERALSQLLAEVEALEEPDPGAAYWNGFDDRIQARLHPTQPRRRRGPWPLWLGLAAAAVLLLMLLPRGIAPKSAHSLDQLSGNDLALIGEAFAPLPVEEATLAPSEGELDILLDSLDERGSEIFDDLIEVDPQALKLLWEREG